VKDPYLGQWENPTAAQENLQAQIDGLLAQYQAHINAVLAEATPLGHGVLITWQGTGYTVEVDFETPARTITARRIPE
jgi:hypothetical protein